MQTVLATMLQTTTYVAPPPLMTDNGSIWHHMSDALHQSLYRVLSLLIAILPGILAFFVALGVFTLIGMVLSALLRRGLKAAKFDDRIARDRGDVNWTPLTSPTALVARTDLLGLRSAGAHHRCLRVRHLICHGYHASDLTAALPDARGGRHSSADRRYPDCPLPGTIGSHRGCQCATSIRAVPVSRSQVAGPRSDRRHGA